MAVRMAECMGLHRDGEEYGLTPLETHVRRVIWNQLCFLDIRTCEAQGPRPVIRREEYDTRLPLNCDDTEVTHENAPDPDSCAGRWTPITLPLIRFEINEMMRISEFKFRYPNGIPVITCFLCLFPSGSLSIIAGTVKELGTCGNKSYYQLPLRHDLKSYSTGD